MEFNPPGTEESTVTGSKRLFFFERETKRELLCYLMAFMLYDHQINQKEGFARGAVGEKCLFFGLLTYVPGIAKGSGKSDISISFSRKRPFRFEFTVRKVRKLHFSLSQTDPWTYM